jgi:hypothetical protein
MHFFYLRLLAFLVLSHSRMAGAWRSAPASSTILGVAIVATSILSQGKNSPPDAARKRGRASSQMSC